MSPGAPAGDRRGEVRIAAGALKESGAILKRDSGVVASASYSSGLLQVCAVVKPRCPGEREGPPQSEVRQVKFLFEIFTGLG